MRPRLAVGPIIVALLALALAGCDRATDTTGDGVSDSSTSPTETPADVTDLTGVPDGTILTPAAYALSAYDSATAPRFVIDVPAGYEGYRGLFVLSVEKISNGDDAFGIAYWSPTGVYPDACTGHGLAPALGGTARAVARDLAAQTSVHTTRPRPTSIDGRTGWYVEMTVPRHAELSGCDAEDLDYFQARPQGARHTNTSGMVDRMWVLDAGGEVVVIDSAFAPQASAEHIEESRRMVEHGHFIPAR